MQTVEGTMSKEQLLQEFANAYEQLIGTATEAAQHGVTRQADRWGPREIVAHLAGWEVIATVHVPKVAAMQTDPIATILAAQQPEGYRVKPSPGYNPNYRGTVWQLTFLDQLGADGTEARVQAACDYVLSHSQARTGGFASWEGGSRPEAPPPPSLVIHCHNGNLLRALIGFGWLE